MPQEKNYFDNRESWYIHRTSGFMYTTTLSGEAAAEEAFHITNGPDDCLTDEQRELLLKKDFKGPPVVTGDIVRIESVVTRRMPSYYLCKSFGWEEYNGDRIQLLKYLG